MALTIGCMIAGLAFLIAVGCAFGGNEGSIEMRVERQAMRPPTLPPRRTPPLDPLVTLTVEWLADPRPAWETVDAFERDVERVLHGDTTRQGSRMPLRVRQVGLVELRQRAISMGLYEGWQDGR